jgi:hypothetical protein
MKTKQKYYELRFIAEKGTHQQAERCYPRKTFGRYFRFIQ